MLVSIDMSERKREREIYSFQQFLYRASESVSIFKKNFDFFREMEKAGLEI